MLIAKVDATAENAKFTAESQDIKSYPTIKYFSKGSSVPIDYNGERTEQAFIEYLNEEAGTHRAVGGGLNAKAGTIGLLDTMVDDFVAGGNSATVFDEASKAARVAKGKYADYYVKVFEKVSKSQGYAAKELARLEGLIKNGGLAPEKADDLVSRSNILRKFSETKEKAKQEL